MVLLAVLPAVPARAAEVVTLPPAEVQEVLSDVPLEDLSAVQLSELLSQLPGLTTLPQGQLQEALTKAIETLAGEGGTLAQLSNPTGLISNLEGGLGEVLSPLELLGLLKGESLTTLLTGGLGTPEATQLLGGLLSSAPDAKQLIEQVLAAVNGEQLETLLGTTLAGEPVSMGTVEELAGQLGTTDEGLAEALGKTTTQLPPGALALTAPLANGKTLGMLNGVEGLTFDLLGPSPEEGPAGGSGGGAGGAGGSGGASGGSGGSSGGSSGTPGGTTVVINALAPPSPTAAASTTQAGLAKVKILSRRVRRHTVTLLVQVPAAGTLTVTGRGLRSLRKQASRAERVTLRASLTKAAVTSLRAHRRHRRIALRVSFAAVGGRGSSASTTVTFG
ncbi:MAG TPA: hypothetical protein VFY36_11480 [Solirubrobacteraceae bacterium]|nr:hypothetical protein [Solirubrobacteraceae bacterium]